MNPAEGKAVWLIGSGFSAPLGGPLLSDLFRQETKEEILPFFPETYPDLAESLPWVQRAFHLGVKKGLWRNAEQYLAFVDDAYRGGGRAKRGRIDKLIVDSNEEVLLNATYAGAYQQAQAYRAKVIANFDGLVKRGLASEVSRFLIQNPPTAEPWLPYRNWIASLRPGLDTVVSFNYDKVLEIAAKAASVESRIWFGVPNQEVPSGKVPVLKLHGSVGWKLAPDPENDKNQIVDTASNDDLLRRQDVDIAIAAPGGTKSDFVSTYFGSLWSLAEEALTSAAALYVVGYSFPDTDPSAQYRLLNAFAAGSANPRAAHIVLGADITAASRRMLSLIRSTARGRVVRVSEAPENLRGGLNIVQHPLGTQDFIGRHADFTSPGT